MSKDRYARMVRSRGSTKREAFGDSAIRGGGLPLPGCQDLEPEHARAGRLGCIIRHETSEPQLLHGGQVKAVKRATVGIADIPMLRLS